MFESLYLAMEPTCDFVAQGGRLEKSKLQMLRQMEVVRVLVDGCYQSILKQSGNLKQKGTMAKKFALQP